MDLTSGVKQAADELLPLLKSFIDKVPDNIKETFQSDIDLVLKHADTLSADWQTSIQANEDTLLIKVDSYITRLEKVVERFDGATVTLNLKKENNEINT